MKVDPIEKEGTTITRKSFWDDMAGIVGSLEKKEGRNVSVNVHHGYGTIVNVTRERGGPTPPSPCNCDEIGEHFVQCDHREYVEGDPVPPWPDLWDCTSIVLSCCQAERNGVDFSPAHLSDTRIRVTTTDVPFTCDVYFHLEWDFEPYLFDPPESGTVDVVLHAGDIYSDVAEFLHPDVDGRIKVNIVSCYQP